MMKTFISFLITSFLLFGITYLGVKKWVTKTYETSNYHLEKLFVNKLDSGNIDILDNNLNPKLISLWATWCKPCVEELKLIDTSILQKNRNNIFFLSKEEKLTIINFLNKSTITDKANYFQYSEHDSIIDFSILPRTIILNPFNKIIWQKTGQLNNDDIHIVDSMLNKKAKSVKLF